MTVDEKLTIIVAAARDRRLNPLAVRVLVLLMEIIQPGVPGPAAGELAHLVGRTIQPTYSALKTLRLAGWIRWRKRVRSTPIFEIVVPVMTVRPPSLDVDLNEHKQAGAAVATASGRR